jgi:hypothetical protein
MIVAVQHKAYQGRGGKRHGNRYMYLDPETGAKCSSSSKSQVRSRLWNEFGVRWQDVQLIHVSLETEGWLMVTLVGLRQLVKETAAA